MIHLSYFTPEFLYHVTKHSCYSDIKERWTELSITQN